MKLKSWHLFPLFFLAAGGTAVAEHISGTEAYRLAAA